MAPNPLAVWAKEHGVEDLDGTRLSWALFAELQKLEEWQRVHEATWARLPETIRTIYMREYREVVNNLPPS